MIRSIALVFALLCTISIAASVHATDSFDSPVWYLDYSVTVKSNYHGSETNVRGTFATTCVAEEFFAATAKLDMRNMGQVITTVQSMTLDPDKYKKMSPAEQLKATQEMMDAMQDYANWMPGPLEVGSELADMQQHMLAVSVPVRISYEWVSTGTNLVNETGDKYDLEDRTTASGSGPHGYVGDQFKFEMNTKTKKYWLVAPYSFQDLDTDSNALKWVHVTKTCAPGFKNCDEEKKTDESPMDRIAVAIDALPNGTQWPVIEGTSDGSGRISGETTFPGHFTQGAANVPVTVTYRYTLTTTPPAPKPATAKK
jgi:hypothetical protein